MNALAPLLAFTDDELDELLALSAQYDRLADFVRAFWTVAQPGRPVVWGWHLEYVCDRIQAHLERGWGTLVICMPVRGGKSTVVNVLAQAWDWLHRPGRQWANISKSDSNASRDSRRTRKVIQSAQYQRLARLVGVADDLAFEVDQNEKRNFVNVSGGGRQCITSGGSITGADVDVLVIDDALDAKDVEIATPQQAAARCAEVVDRFDNIWTDRFSPQPDITDHEPGVRIVVAQRLHDADLPGTLIARKREGAPDIEVIVIPETFRPDHPDREFFPACDPRTEPGQFLNPALRGAAVRDAVLARPGGARKWSTRYEQLPVAREGGWVKRADIEAARYNDEPEVQARSCAEIWITVDPAGIEEATGEDNTVMQVHGRIGDFLFVLDEVAGRWGITEQRRQLQTLIARWPRAGLRYVERTVNGLALLKWAPSAGIALMPVDTAGRDKLERGQDLIALAEQRRVRFPACRTWPSGGSVETTIDEVCGFGAGAARDDRWDALAYGAMHLSRRTLAVARRGGLRG